MTSILVPFEEDHCCHSLAPISWLLIFYVSKPLVMIQVIEGVDPTYSQRVLSKLGERSIDVSPLGHACGNICLGECPVLRLYAATCCQSLVLDVQKWQRNAYLENFQIGSDGGIWFLDPQQERIRDDVVE